MHVLLTCHSHVHLSLTHHSYLVLVLVWKLCSLEDVSPPVFKHANCPSQNERMFQYLFQVIYLNILSLG